MGQPGPHPAAGNVTDDKWAQNAGGGQAANGRHH